MSEAKKPTTKKVGQIVEVKDGATVVTPTRTFTVSGGLVVLDQPGTFVVDGDEYVAKP